MGGFCGAISNRDVVLDVYFGTDYHSHLGTRRGGMAAWDPELGFQREIHNIENAPFRTKFDKTVGEMVGKCCIGSISDTDPQPLLVRSHLGLYAISTVGIINNTDELIETYFSDHGHQFMAQSNGKVNVSELVAALINMKENLIDGILYAQEMIKGSITILLMTPDGILAARDRLGRTPVIIGRKKGAYCASFESFAYLNLGYEDCRELGPGEVVFLTPESVETILPPAEKMKICTFLWVYFGYPSSTYEKMNVEKMRYNCGDMLARRDSVEADSVAGVPDSGTAHAIGYANRSGIPFSRPFIKYTPTWPRSFMPSNQTKRNLIARMKLIPVDTLIRGKRLILIDDSIVRGTQLRETTEFLYHSVSKEVHIRPACPPLLFGCKYLNFSRSTSDMDLITRRVIASLEDGDGGKNLAAYADPDSPQYAEMIECIRRELKFTSLKYHRLDDMLAAAGGDPCRFCTYCWTGREE